MQKILKRNVTKRIPLACVMGFAALLYLFPPALHAETTLQGMLYSPDVTVVLAGETLNDEDLAEDDLAGTVTLVNVGTLPSSADVNAYHGLSGGDQLLSFDTTVSLPGGIIAGPGDVVRFDGTTYTIEFDSTANGLPTGVLTDAVCVIPDGGLLLSFDITVNLGDITADDEDLVRLEDANFSLFFDGTGSGVSATLDLDGAHYLCNGNLLLSFDGSGKVDSVAFDDEDVLEYDPAYGTWELAYDGSYQHAHWAVADLDAMTALEVTVNISGGAYNFPEHLRYRATFSMDVSGPSALSGWLKYYYSRTRMNFASTAITEVSFSDNTATISGTGTVSGLEGYTFTAEVSDEEPDSFGITIKKPNGSLYYWAEPSTVNGGDLIISQS